MPIYSFFFTSSNKFIKLSKYIILGNKNKSKKQHILLSYSFCPTEMHTSLEVMCMELDICLNRSKGMGNKERENSNF